MPPLEASLGLFLAQESKSHSSGTPKSMLRTENPDITPFELRHEFCPWDSFYEKWTSNSESGAQNGPAFLVSCGSVFTKEKQKKDRRCFKPGLLGTHQNLGAPVVCGLERGTWCAALESDTGHKTVGHKELDKWSETNQRLILWQEKCLKQDNISSTK